MANCSYFDDTVLQPIHNAIVTIDAFTQAWIIVLRNYTAYLGK